LPSHLGHIVSSSKKGSISGGFVRVGDDRASWLTTHSHSYRHHVPVLTRLLASSPAAEPPPSVCVDPPGARDDEMPTADAFGSDGDEIEDSDFDNSNIAERRDKA
jgi:hypothetical protein